MALNINHPADTITPTSGTLNVVGTLQAGGSTVRTGTVAIADGGTGQTSANAALNALLPSQASANGKVLTSDGTDASWVTPTVTGLPTFAVLGSNQSTTTSYVDLTGFSFTGDANKTYIVELIGSFNGSGTTSAPFLALTVPGTSTVVGSSFYPGLNGSNPQPVNSSDQIASAAIVATNPTIRVGSSTTLPVQGRWVVKMDGTGGTVKMRAATRASTGNILAGTVFSYVKVN